MIRLFERLRAEGGVVETLRHWLARHPPRRTSFTQSLAGIARRALSDEPFAFAVREFLDEFQLLPDDALRMDAISERPPATGDRRQDAYLAALGEHLASQHGLERPAWTCEPDRFLDRFWFVSDVEGFRALAIARAPAAFRRRGVLIPAESLRRV